MLSSGQRQRSIATTECLGVTSAPEICFTQSRQAAKKEKLVGDRPKEYGILSKRRFIGHGAPPGRSRYFWTDQRTRFSSAMGST